VARNDKLNIASDKIRWSSNLSQDKLREESPFKKKKYNEILRTACPERSEWAQNDKVLFFI